jgi:hypothetical protein
MLLHWFLPSPFRLLPSTGAPRDEDKRKATGVITRSSADF